MASAAESGSLTAEEILVWHETAEGQRQAQLGRALARGDVRAVLAILLETMPGDEAEHVLAGLL